MTRCSKLGNSLVAITKCFIEESGIYELELKEDGSQFQQGIIHPRESDISEESAVKLL